MPEKATIKHIEFWISDLKRSIKFYQGIFKIIGWGQTEKNAFSNGETKIYFIEQNVKLQKTVGPRHLCFLANSTKTVDKVGQFLIKNSYKIIRGPLDAGYKNRKSYTVDFKDPDGYIIEIATKSVAGRKNKKKV